MSLSYQPLESVLVKDPRVIVDNKRVYAILKCGKQTNFKRWTTNSVSSSNINFSTPPPSSGIIVDRKITLTLPMRLTIEVTAPAHAAGHVSAVTALVQNEFAPRAFPIHSMLNTVQLTINNCSMTQNIGDIIHALLRFNTFQELMATDYSETPSCLDTYCSYNSGGGKNNNPLGLDSNKAFFGMSPRGGFAYYRIVYNQTVNTSNANATIRTAIVDMLCTEQIMMSPLYWGKDNASGFTNVVSMDWVFNFYNQAGFRAISYMKRNLVNPANGNNAQIKITRADVQFSGFSGVDFSYAQREPTLNITYITPEGQYAVPPSTPISYPYFSIDKFTTKAGGPLVNTRNPSGYGVQPVTSIVSNNIQLSSIPRRVYIYVRPDNQNLLIDSSISDCYYSIESINIQFGNKTGLFAEANKEQLYNISRKNHCSLSWNEWSGGPVYQRYLTNDNAAAVTLSAIPLGTVGSVFCFEFASDLGLEPSEAPGLGQGSYNLQVRVEYKNPNLEFPENGGVAPNENAADNFSWNNITPCLYVVPVYEGTFTITGLGSAMTQTAVISNSDIQEAQQNPMYNYKDVQEVNGGNFMSGLKNLVPRLKQANKFLKDNKVVSRAADAASYIPGMVGDVARDISSVAKQYGYGYGYEGGCEGGVVLGGAKMTKKQLQNRLKNR